MRLSVRSPRLVTAFVCLLLLGFTKPAQAISLTFQGLVRPVNTGGSIVLSSPAALVVDPTGNLFIADTSNNQIVEVNAQGTASVLTISGLSPASLSSPSGIAIDGAANLYIADTGNNRVVKVGPSGAGSTISTGSVNLSIPHGIALDQSGDIFIGDTGDSRIVEVTSGGTPAALTINVSSGAPSLNSPKGLAVDASGKLYIADSNNSRVVTVAAGSTTGVVFSTGGLSPALSNPSGVAVDRVGNVVIADTGHNRIVEVDKAGAGTDLANLLSAGSLLLSAPLGVAVDAFGAVYIADSSNSRALVVDPGTDWDPGSGAGYTSSSNKSAVGFGHITLGSSTPTSLILNFSVGSPVSGLGGVKVFTSGTQGLDFQIVSGGNTTCSSSTVSGTTCAVEVSFLPTAPGLRNGQLVLYEPGSNPVLTVPLYGFGDAPVAALSPNTGSVINTGGLTLSDPFQVALDGAGNIYVGNYSTTNVTKIPAGGGSAVLVNLGTPGDIAPQSITGVAIDGAGNLFIGDHINSRILVVTPGGVVSVLTINGLSTALELPTALAFDASGALYIADYGSGRIVEVSSIQVTGSTSTGIATVINTGSYSFGISTLSGVTVDRQGTLYAAARTQNNSSIIKITASGIVSAVAIPNNITPAISGPQGLTTDAMGNLYIVDSGNNRMVKITTAGVASVLGLSGLPSPSSLGSSIFGVTVDPSGNVYIPDWSNNRLVFVNVSGSALTYANTNQGQTSSDSPRTATVTNLGNEPLVFSTNPTYTANFSNNGNDTNPCTSSTSLSSGTACDLSINFTPQSAGSLSAGITVTDNTLNVAASTQQVSVSGTGIASGDTTSTTLTLSPTSLANGQAVTMTATVADTTTVSHTPTGSVTFTDTVGSTIVSLGPATLSGGVGTKTGVQLSGIGSHTITASYAGVGGTFIASTTTATVALSKAPVTLAGPVAQPVLVTIGQASSAVITVSGPYTTIAAPGGALTYSILNSSNVSVASGSLTLAAGETSSTATVPLASTLASGAYTISGNYGGDSNYLPSSAPVTITVTVSATAPTITWNPSATSIVYGANLGGILDATASYGDSTVPGTFAYTAASGASPFAVLAGTILSAATYTLTATFTPTNTTNYAVVHRSITLLVTKAAATISWIPGATSITYGASLSSILNATASNGSSTVAGIFAYTATLSGGSPVVVVAGTILAAGSYMLTATFTPTDTTDFTAAPSSITLVVSKATATISWSPGATSITYGAGLSGILDATASSGSTTVAGTFAYTAAASGASPFAILAGTILPAGTYTLTATFTPTDTTDFAAAPSSITLIVIKATPAISWNPGATSISYGANLSSILDATALSGGSTIAGTVAYTAAASGASPVAVVAGTILAVGSYTLTATFTPSNSTSYGTALSSITLTVSKAVAAISLTSSSSTVAPGIAIVFTAAVSSSVGTPTGAVSFSDGTGLLATVALSGGTAAYSTSSLAAGAQSITASYSGDNNFAPSTSSAIIETVQDFNLTLASSSPGGATQTVVPGGTATYDLAIGPSSGPTFPAAISLTVSGLPPGATATISPQVLPAGSGLSNVTLTIVLAKTTAALGGGDGLSRRLAPMLLGILVLPFAVRIRRTGARFGRMVCALVVVMAGCGLVAGLSGCGSSSSGFFGQAPQSYSVIITGTSGSISHSTTVVLVIQ